MPQLATATAATRPIKPEYQHYLGSFVLQAAMMISMTVIPFFTFQHLGGREKGVALVYGVQVLSLGLVCLLSAPFVSALPNGLVYCLIGAIGFGVCYCAALFATTITVFCILTGLALGFFGLAWPAMQSWLGAQPDGKLRTSFSCFNIAIGLGLTVGPLVAGALYAADFRLPFVGVFLLSVLAAILLYTLPREKNYFGADARVGDPDAAVEAPSPPDPRNEIYLYCGWLTNMMGWGLTGAVRTVYSGQVDQLVQRGQLVLYSQRVPLHVFTAQEGPSAATLYSWMQAVLSLGFFLAVLVMGRTLRWQHRFSVLVGAEILLGAGIWLLTGSRSLLLILLCHLVMGAFTGFGYMASQCYCAANPQFKHKRIALNEGLSHSMGFSVPLAFAQLGAWYGMTWPFRNTPLMLAGFAGVQLLSLWYGKTRLARVDLAAQAI